MDLTRLYTLIRAVCPVHSVHVPDATNKVTWYVSPRPEATAQQLANAQAVIDAYDTSDAAQLAWEADRNPERKDLRAAAAQAIADINTYLALSNPTNAQNTAQVRRLSIMMRAVIKRLVQLD